MKVNPAEQPVLYLSLDSEVLPLYTVNEYADTILAQRISMINGVSRVMIYGAQKYGVRGVPVFQCFPDSVAGLAAKTPREREVARGQGYIEPQPFLDMFRFVADRAYEKGEVLRLPQSEKFSQP